MRFAMPNAKAHILDLLNSILRGNEFDLVHQIGEGWDDVSSSFFAVG